MAFWRRGGRDDDTEPASMLDILPAAEPGAQTEPEPEPQPQTQPEPEPQPQTQPEPGPEVEVQPEPEPVTRAEHTAPPADHESVDHDDVFPFFTPGQAVRFRILVQQAFASAGIEVVPHEQHMQAAEGQQFGLFDLAAACNSAPEGEAGWPTRIAEHVALVLRSSRGIDLSGMDPDDVLTRVLPRLMGTSTLPRDWRQRFGYAKRLAGDLVELLAVDLPEAVTMLSDADVERFGHEALTAAAYDNLRGTPLDSYEVIGQGGDGDLHTIEGESHFVASKLLVLEDLLQDTVGERIWDFGVVVSMPVRHQLIFHPIRDLGALEAIRTMSTFTAAIFHESAGGVSPYVYWWQRGALSQLTELDDDGQPRAIDNDELSAILDELGMVASD